MDIKKSGIFLVVVFLLSVIAEFDQRKDELIMFVTETPAAMVGQALHETDLGAVQDELLRAITGPGDEALQALMADHFMFAVWPSEPAQWTPTAAIDELRSGYFPQTGVITFSPAPELEDLLHAAELPAKWAAVMDDASVTYSQGWGEDGQGEAVLVFSRRADGTIAWKGLLILP